MIRATHLKNDNSSPFVSSRQQITIVIEFDARDHIGVGNVII
jgi:hypothetical protein